MNLALSGGSDRAKTAQMPVNPTGVCRFGGWWRRNSYPSIRPARLFFACDTVSVAPGKATGYFLEQDTFWDGRTGAESADQAAYAPILQTALSEEEWATLLKSGRPVKFSKGESIIARGSAGDCLYVIQMGRVEVSIVLAEGHKAVLNQMGPGEVLGEIALLDGGPRSADATAASPEVQLIAIGKREILGILDGSSDVAMTLIRELCRRVRNASDMFEVKSEKSARVRLARSLLRLAAKWGRAGGSETRIKGFSQSELGDLAGLARENVNRQLKLWEEAGILRWDDEGIVLQDADAIAEEAQL